MMRFLRLRAGASVQQYALITGLVGVIALAAVSSMGTGIKGMFTNTSNVLTKVTNGSIVVAAPVVVQTLPNNCVDSGGYKWCEVVTSTGCGGNYDTGPTSLGSICASAGYSWAGDFTLPDGTAYSIADLLRVKAGFASQTAVDGCGSSSGGNNSFAMNGGGICSRETRVQTAADQPCSPWASYNGTNWHVFSRCQ